MKSIKFFIRIFLNLLMFAVKISFALLQFTLGLAVVIFKVAAISPKRRNYY